MFSRIVGIAFVYLLALCGWVALGGTIVYRTDNQDSELRREVGQLWGTPLAQSAPCASLAVARVVETEKVDRLTQKKTIERATETDTYHVPIVKSDIAVDLDLDQRQKGLLWYSTYKVRFTGNYVFENIHDKKGEMVLTFSFPASDGLYDEFRFEVDGSEVPFTREQGNRLIARIPGEPKSRHTLAVNYKSNGLDSFHYRFGDGISEVRDFQLVANTNFDGFNFPGNTISPGYKKRADGGWELGWQYSDLIAGNSIGVEMPKKINPGPMAARISFFAPVSLGFFFFLIFIISLLRGVNIHPVNYFFLAAAFFAFHLLLAYLVDHISIHLAFLICSAVSIFLVVSYMRIVAGDRFAFFETALAQVIYLIGFSYAFFIEGFTGLAVTIGSIITLFVVMQMTARINWSEKFALRGAPAVVEGPPLKPLRPSSAVE